jgi:hypothetical protein
LLGIGWWWAIAQRTTTGGNEKHEEQKRKCAAHKKHPFGDETLVSGGNLANKTPPLYG